MKSVFASLILLAGLTAAFGQNEQSPIVEKEINYKNWTYRSVRTGEEISLRNAVAGKKLAIVVYFAPWCGNWRHDAPILERLYEKYKWNGLEIVGVGEYDPVDSMKSNLETLKITFQAVYESENRTQKQSTKHYDYRRFTGDTRNWGSPWYIFLEPAKFEKKGDVLTKKTLVINGEMIEAEGEKLIREKLGLPAVDPKATTAGSGKIEVCDTEKKLVDPKKP
jgi:thiol-disulfide isomerase/thioredoxin